MGFEFAEVGANDSGLRDCYYREHGKSDSLLNGGFVLLTLTTEFHRFQKLEGRPIASPGGSFSPVHRKNQLPEFQCGAQTMMNRTIVSVAFYVDMLQKTDFKDNCHKSVSLAEIESNLID
ncbi:hypothetical protein [Corynebacterium auriscanis]|uniref:hypothetical protein n=1 Tax=Corynebacterium auriscanis TaxID=99807 RepID=UPI003CE8260C